MTREDQKNRSESVRQAILDTALQIGLEEGFEAITVRKIIGRMKYSTGVVYHYFKDKQEIIDAVEASETAELHQIITGIEDKTADAMTNIVMVFRWLMQLALDVPEKYNLIVLHKYTKCKPSPTPWVDHISEMLKRDMQGGHIKAMDAQQAAFSIWSSFVGFNLMISRLEGITAEKAGALFDTQVAIILKGVLNQ